MRHGGGLYVRGWMLSKLNAVKNSHRKVVPTVEEHHFSVNVTLSRSINGPVGTAL